MDLGTIRTAKRYGKVVCPGALSPTEAVAAWEAGADIIKIFPASMLGPAQIQALAGPLPQVRYLPVGGVNLDSAAAFIRAGACALGVGGSLVNSKTIAAGDWDAIAETARRFIDAVASARGV
jgi:2-dehydro-3-deoxyphosphogluconate aldolase/(4S)-4-hydroxy-2-oxoglutarate aldolase